MRTTATSLWCGAGLTPRLFLWQLVGRRVERYMKPLNDEYFATSLGDAKVLGVVIASHIDTIKSRTAAAA